MELLRNSRIEAEINTENLVVILRDRQSGAVWKMQESSFGDLGIRGHCGMYQMFHFQEARSHQIGRINETTLEITLSGWSYSANVWAELDFGITVRFTLENNDLVIAMIPFRQERQEASMIDSGYPRGFLFSGNAGGRLILPHAQGVLLDRNEPDIPDMIIPSHVGMGFIMPWWAQLEDSGNALLGLPETTDDLAFRLCRDSVHGFTVHPCHLPSLGGLRYERSVRYRLLAGSSIMKLAQEYRRFADTRGLGVTLRRKAAERPVVEQLRGGAFWNIWMMSDFRNVRPEAGVQYLSFAKAAERYIRRAELSGLDRVVAHIDGWGHDGYDFNHPDVLPPDERLGGWDGLKKFCETVHSRGHGFILHDNYVDYYKHTPSFANGDGVTALDGLRHFSTEWLGGAQEWLCSLKAGSYLKRNLDEILRKCPIDGEYVDCWTISHLRECYDRNHPADRKDTRLAWSENFREFQQRGLLIGSESGNDWAVPFIDFCHTVQPDFLPHVLRGRKSSFGISIPLYNMVWHDCVVCPVWIPATREKAVIREGLALPVQRDPRLWGLLWGGIPSYRTESMTTGNSEPDSTEKEFIAQAKILSDFHSAVGFEPITEFELLSSDGSVQRTVFADGSSAEVNFAEERSQLNCRGKITEPRFL